MRAAAQCRQPLHPARGRRANAKSGFTRQLAERGDAGIVPDVALLPALWNGRAEDAYGEAAVIGTAAAALLALGGANDADAALALARDYWRRRGPWPGDAP